MVREMWSGCFEHYSEKKIESIDYFFKQSLETRPETQLQHLPLK
jgi:HJR/Mrr/RecB family endonuclease